MAKVGLGFPALLTGSNYIGWIQLKKPLRLTMTRLNRIHSATKSRRALHGRARR
jgi:hypothetical protein